MNSLHLLASTVDKALSLTDANGSANASEQQKQEALVNDDDIVTRADTVSALDADEQAVDDDGDDESRGDEFYEEDFDDRSNDMIWRLIHAVLFIPKHVIWIPLCWIVQFATFPLRFALGLLLRADNALEGDESVAAVDLDDDDEDENTLLGDTSYSSGVDGISPFRSKVHRNSSVSGAISEEDDEDLEFEIPSESSTLADRLKSPTSPNSSTILEEDEDRLMRTPTQQERNRERDQLRQQKLVEQQSAKKKTTAKKKKQRFVFPRLLINNSFDLFHPPKSLRKKTLILDLDETLIHSLSRHNSSVLSKSKGKMIEIKVSNQLATLYYIYKRPFVDEFLNVVKNWYDLICFTASIKEYADPVIDFLEEDFINNKGTNAFGSNGNGSERLFQKRYYRNDCVHVSGVGYIKDLTILTGDDSSSLGAAAQQLDDTPTSNQRGRSLQKADESESESSSRSNSATKTTTPQRLRQAAMAQEYVDPAKLVIIDNSPVSYSMNKDNGIMIEGWINDPNDAELMNLLPLLNSLRFTSDVRAVLSLKAGESSFQQR